MRPIISTRQVYFDSGYLRIKDLDGKRKRIHRIIWEKANGSIPEGMIIHHRDKNKLNNSLDNLELITKAEHAKIHATKNRICSICPKKHSAKGFCQYHYKKNIKTPYSSNIIGTK